MGQPRAFRRHRQRADAGIAEEVERFGAVAETLPHPGPLRRHVREESEVAERGALGAEPHLLPAELPALARHRPGELPAPAAFFVRAGDELPVRVPIGGGRRPQSLRLGPDEAVAAVALELAAMARIDEAVIGPGLGDQGQCRHPGEGRDLRTRSHGTSPRDPGLRRGDGLPGRHAAFASLPPTLATARGPASIWAPAALTSSRVTASSRATISAGSTSRPSRSSRVAT